MVDVSSFKEIFRERYGVKFEKKNSHRAVGHYSGGDIGRCKISPPIARRRGISIVIPARSGSTLSDHES